MSFYGVTDSYGGELYMPYFYSKNCDPNKLIKFGDNASFNDMDVRFGNWGKVGGLAPVFSFTQFTELESGDYCLYLKAFKNLIDEAILYGQTARCYSIV